MKLWHESRNVNESRKNLKMTSAFDIIINVFIVPGWNFNWKRSNYKSIMMCNCDEPIDLNDRWRHAQKWRNKWNIERDRKSFPSMETREWCHETRFSCLYLRWVHRETNKSPTFAAILCLVFTLTCDEISGTVWDLFVESVSLNFFSNFHYLMKSALNHPK